MLDACRRRACGRLVHVSSPSVAHAGRPLVGVGAEAADPATARGHYARTKAVAERLALSADAAALAVLVVRPHLVWGPGDTQLVARIVARARAGRLPLLGRGTALVDTTYVDNAVTRSSRPSTRTAHGEATGGLQRRAPAGARGADPAVPGRGRTGAPHRGPGPALPADRGGRGRRLGGDAAGTDDPPITRFLAEQLTTAHWFDQRRTREALGWTPDVGLDAGFARLAEWYATGEPPLRPR